MTHASSAPQPLPTPPRDAEKVVEVAAHTGRMLLGSSASATEVVRAIRGITAHEGIAGVQADVTYNQLTVSQHTPGHVPWTWFETVGPRSFNYGRYTQVARLLDDYLNDRLDLAGLSRGLHQADQGPSRYPTWASRLAAGTAGITTATIFGAGPVAAVAAFVANVLIDWMFTVLGRRRWPVFFLQLLTGVVAIAAAALVRVVAPGTDTSQLVVAVIILMLCGMTSTGAVQDLLTGWYLTGSGRLIEALVNTLGLIVGIRLGLAVVGAAGLDLAVRSDVSFIGDPAWLMVLVSAAVACAFSVYAQMPGRTLPALALMTVLGWTAYSMLLDHSVGPVWAAGGAALVAGLLSPLLASRIKVPAAVLASIAIIPLFPGIVLYRGLLAGLTQQGQGLELIMTAIGTAGALACGVMLGQHLGALLLDGLRETAARTTTYLPHLRDSRARPGAEGQPDPEFAEPHDEQGGIHS